MQWVQMNSDLYVKQQRAQEALFQTCEQMYDFFCCCCFPLKLLSLLSLHHKAKMAPPE